MSHRALFFLLILGLSLPCSADKRPGVDYGKYGKTKGAFRGKYWHHYERGASFAEGGFWEEAAEDFQKAAKKRDEDERGARTYGMRYIQYYPHRELGVSYYHMGKFEEARKELELSYSQVKTGKAEYFLERSLKAIATSGNDTSAPRITIKTPEDGSVSTKKSTQLIVLIEDDRYVDSIRVNHNVIPIPGDREIELAERIKLARGENWLRVEAWDAAGNSSSDSILVTVD
jgi:tetratricopeptide (TPR) repeat protein